MKLILINIINFIVTYFVISGFDIALSKVTKVKRMPVKMRFIGVVISMIVGNLLCILN